jgi:hypothetical protein
LLLVPAGGREFFLLPVFAGGSPSPCVVVDLAAATSGSVCSSFTSSWSVLDRDENGSDTMDITDIVFVFVFMSVFGFKYG